MSRPFDPRPRILALLFASALLFACEGDSGPSGAAGDTGTQGPIGPQGPQGDPGSSTVPVETAEFINVSYDSITVPAGGGAPTVVVRLKNDVGWGLSGLPAANIRFTIAQLSPGQNGASSEWQSYITQESNGIADAQATTETATAGDYTDNGDGTYTYTFLQALTDYPAGPAYDEAKIHRLGTEIRTNSGGFLPGNIPANNEPFDFLPSGGAVDDDDNRLIVNNDTCNACHDNLEFHGDARFDIEYCVTCHNPYSIDGDTVNETWGGTVDMKEMIHKIHYGENLTNGYFVFGFGGNLHDYSDVVFTQDVRNCQTCHNDSNPDVPQASNWFQVQNRSACGSCHDDIDWTAGDHPGGIVFNDDTLCAVCHGEDAAAAGGSVRVQTAHEIPEAVAAEAFEYDVVSVSNAAPGSIPSVSIRVLDPTDPNYATDPGSTAYDINDPAGPFQAAGARLRVDVAWTTSQLGNMDPNNDLARASDSGAPFAPIVIDFGSGATNDGNNVFTKAAPSAIPTEIEGSGIAALEGRPRVDLGNGLESLGVEGDSLAFVITDTDPVDRRQVVDIAKCNDCHNTLALHGDNRVGNTELCSTCHNPNATDINRRVADSECDDELGLIDTSIDLKRMIHRIHAGNVGICGFNNSAHDYTGLVYPGRLNNCEGCHLSDTFYPVDPTAVLGTSERAGTDRSLLVDDTVISPNTAVCSSCHTSDLAANHMLQNGGDFNAGKDEYGVLISSGSETCQLCHGPGGSADTREAHSIDTFESN